MAKQTEGGAIVTIGDWATRPSVPRLCRLFCEQRGGARRSPSPWRSNWRTAMNVSASTASSRPVMVPENLSEHEAKARPPARCCNASAAGNRGRGRGFPGRKRLYYRCLSAGGRRPHHRLDVAAVFGPRKRGEQARRPKRFVQHGSFPARSDTMSNCISLRTCDARYRRSFVLSMLACGDLRRPAPRRRRAPRAGNCPSSSTPTSATTSTTPGRWSCC